MSHDPFRAVFGSFSKPTSNPVLKPRTNTIFRCPLSGDLAWEAKDVFNPAAVMHDGQVQLLYRAEDHEGRYAGTSRVGLATSSDGESFERETQPVLFPDCDEWQSLEWEGGCEDPRVVQAPDGSFVLTYTAFNGAKAILCVATSPDLRSWRKHGPAFAGAHGGKYASRWSKSGAIVTELQNETLVAKRIKNKFWMYWGESDIFAATSDDLIRWESVEKQFGFDQTVVAHEGDAVYNTEQSYSATEAVPLFMPRQGRFDSGLVEPGPPALWTEEGIVFIYNSSNNGSDPASPPGTYAPGWVIFDPRDPTALLARCTEPFLRPDAEFERSGQAGRDCIFAEGLVYFENTWRLYYGCGDRFIGVALSAPRNSR
jgi:predicted GH43/DUF377 family glycosyl hydrolase